MRSSEEIVIRRLIGLWFPDCLGRLRHFHILRTAMNEKSHQKQGIQNTKFAKGTTKVTKATAAAVSVVDGVLQKQH
jgi:hypothetical protein